MPTPRFKSDVYDGLRQRYFLHPQISLLTTPSPATMFCDLPKKKLKFADALCNTLADADFCNAEFKIIRFLRKARNLR